MAKKQKQQVASRVWAALRIGLGVIFIWPFFDKLFGLGFSTCRDAKTDIVTMACSKAWVHGGSPTVGFLKFGTKGPLAHMYQTLAGHMWVDWLFMLAILLIGTALLFGIAMRLAVFGGSLLLLMMWSAALWPANNPVIDEHIIYILALLALLTVKGSQAWSLANWWQSQPLVKKYPLLK